MYVTMKNACNLFKANCAQLLKKKREFPLFSAQKSIVKFVVKNNIDVSYMYLVQTFGKDITT